MQKKSFISDINFALIFNNFYIKWEPDCIKQKCVGKPENSTGELLNELENIQMQILWTIDNNLNAPFVLIYNFLLITFLFAVNEHLNLYFSVSIIIFANIF